MIPKAKLAMVGLISLSASTAHSQTKVDDAIALFNQRKLVQARGAFEALAPQRPRDPTVHFYLGRIDLSEQKLEASIEHLEKAVALDDRNSEYHHWLGNALGAQALKANPFSQVMLAGKIKGEYERAVELDPANTDARMALMSLYAMAPSLMGGSIDKAIEQATIIKKQDPLKGHLAFGNVYSNQKKPELVEKEYQAAIREFPKKRDGYLALSLFYQNAKEFEKAFQTIDQWIVAAPDDMMSQFQAGRAAALSGQNLDRGEASLKKYLGHTPADREPSLANAHWRLGMVYEKKGQKDLAKKEYQEALRLDPSHQSAGEMLKKLG